MKPSETVVNALSDMKEVKALSDVRRILSNTMLGIIRKEISATDIVALSTACEAISNSLSVEAKIAKTQVELREKGADLGEVVRMGQLQIY